MSGIKRIAQARSQKAAGKGKAKSFPAMYKKTARGK